MLFRKFAIITALGFASGLATAQTKWDLPTAYATGNFHTENVEKATGGKLKIQVHANASLFKARNISGFGVWRFCNIRWHGTHGANHALFNTTFSAFVATLVFACAATPAWVV